MSLNSIRPNMFKFVSKHWKQRMKDRLASVQHALSPAGKASLLQASPKHASDVQTGHVQGMSPLVDLDLV